MSGAQVVVLTLPRVPSCHLCVNISIDNWHLMDTLFKIRRSIIGNISTLCLGTDKKLSDKKSFRGMFHHLFWSSAQCSPLTFLKYLPHLYQIKLLFCRFLISRKQFENEGVNFVVWNWLLILLDSPVQKQMQPGPHGESWAWGVISSLSGYLWR